MNETSCRLDGTKIKPVVDAQGRRHDWIAASLGVPEYTVTRWFNGTTGMPEDDAVRLLQLLGVPFYLVFEFQERNDLVPFAEHSEAIPA